MTYTPAAPPLVDTKDGRRLLEWFQRELATLARAGNDQQEFLYLSVLHVAPSKPRAGLIVYADGVDWNPGSGEGLYRYTVALAWVFIG